MLSTSRVRFRANSTSLEVNNTLVLATDTWYHIVGTIDSAANTGQLIINDGTPGSTVGTAAAWTSTGLGVGGGQAGGNHLTGRIDEMSMWNRVLTAGEITRLADTGDEWYA